MKRQVPISVCAQTTSPTRIERAMKSMKTLANQTKFALVLSLLGAVFMVVGFLPGSGTRSFVTEPSGATIAMCEGDFWIPLGGGLDMQAPPGPTPGPDHKIRCPYGERHSISIITLDKPFLFWSGFAFTILSLVWQIRLVR